MRVYAMVPARSGSKGLPNKNIMDIDGHPLLSYSVAFGKALGVEQVILSTDSPEYAEIGKRYGAFVPALRGAEASSDTAMEEDIFGDISKTLTEQGIPLPDVWLRLKPTNPFRRIDSVREGLEVLARDASVDSVRIVSPADARLVVRNEDGFLEPLLKDVWDPKRSVMRRTEFPPAFSPFNLDLMRHRVWEERGSGYMGSRIHPVIDHPITGMDINDGDDFEIVKAMIEMRPRPSLVSTYLVDPAL